MSILLRSNMSLNLTTGQVFLTQNTNLDSFSIVTVAKGGTVSKFVGGTTVDMEGESDAGMEGMAGTEVKDPLLSNGFFVGGISVATLAISIVLGILLAKKRIKKGINLYED